MSRRRFSALIGAGLVLLSVLLATLFGEFVLRLVVNQSDFLQATLIDDPALGHRVAPNTSGHDGLGFRNREVPPQVDIVAIGDSYTYGVSATREGSWPQQLGVDLGEPVYNMGLGGYGPLHYLHLAQTTAKSLKPRLMVVGFYFGNDLMDAHLLAHAKPHWQGWRQAELPASAPVIAGGPIAPEPKKRFGALRDWLSRHSVFYSVLRATVLQRFAAQEREDMVRQVSSPDAYWAWTDPAPGSTVRTVFTPQGRLAAIDPALPAVREGIDITKKAFVALQAEADRQGAQLLVMLIPTKERAYCRYLQAQGARLPASFIQLCTAEAQVKAELLGLLAEQRIARLDVSTALETQVERHVQLYPPDADGHAVAAGYGVIAAAVAEVVRRDYRKP